MSNIEPTFSGEVQMRRWSDSSTQGVQVTFALHDREALETLVGKEGKRFMAVLVEVGDDEQPVRPIVRKSPVGPLCREAVELCRNPEFQRWAVDEQDEEAAKDYILDQCVVASRKDLDVDARAAQAFVHCVRIPFLRHMRERKA